LKRRRKSKKLSPSLAVIWGGFNAGAVLGLFDALLVMTFGLGLFDQMGPIMGLITIDAFGIGIVGTLCAAFGYLISIKLRTKLPRLPAIISGLLLLFVSLSITWLNLGWAFNTVRGNPPDDSENLLVISIDTLRADSVGFGGNALVRTPVLDRIIQRGYQLCNAICPVPMTTPSHASMLTSTIPAVHGALKNRYI